MNFSMAKRKKKKRNKYYTYYEPVVDCMACGHEHLYRERRKIKQPKDSPYLTISVCPKCKKEGYVMWGEHAVRRKIKDDEE